MKQIITASPSGATWYFLYTLILAIGMPVIMLVLLSKKRSRGGFLERLGFFSSNFPKHSGGTPVLWFHAVSMGEAMAIVPVVLKIKELYPNSQVFVSTVTDTGRDVILTRLKGVVEHLYFPLDYNVIVNRVLNRLQPDLFLCVDTEIWPNLLRALQKRKVPTLLINGRLSSQSFRGYMWLRPFMKHVMRSISFCSMQSKRDVDRMHALGVSNDRVAFVGSIKCDYDVQNNDLQCVQTFQDFIVEQGGDALLIGASTHQGEEEALLCSYTKLLKEFPSLILLLAPRHIHRIEEVETVIQRHGFAPIRKTFIDKLKANHDAKAGFFSGFFDKPKGVYVLDTHGELAALFQFATIVWVGGSWVPIGGHNLMEPAQCGKPIFFGPYMDHVLEMAEMMLESGGGIQVSTIEAMTAEMAILLRDQGRCNKVGIAAQEVVKNNQGAVDRTLKIIRDLLKDSMPHTSVGRG